jgi:hypothetical protein
MRFKFQRRRAGGRWFRVERPAEYRWVVFPETKYTRSLTIVLTVTEITWVQKTESIPASLITATENYS